MDTRKKLFRRPSRQTVVTLILTVAIIALVGLNILIPYLTQKNGSYVDLTPEGLYTLTDTMKEECARITSDVKITFCSDPDTLLGDTTARYVYIMALQLAREFDFLTVETVNIRLDPTAVDEYRANTMSRLNDNSVIVSSEGLYRIYSTNSFWTTASDGETGGTNDTGEVTHFSFNGEFKMMTAFLSVTSVVRPRVCFTYGHGERFYVSPEDTEHADLRVYSDDKYRAFYELLINAGLEVDYIDLDADTFPEDCLLVVMNGPTVDYDIGDVTSLQASGPFAKLHTFLSKRHGAFMLFKDPTVTLKNLGDFMADWGIAFYDGIYLQDSSQCLTDGDDIPSDHLYQQLIVDLNDDETQVPYHVYSGIADLGSAPRTVVTNTGAVYRSWRDDFIPGSTSTNVSGAYFDFFLTSENALPYTFDGRLDADPSKKVTYAPAGLSLRAEGDQTEGTSKYAYVFGAATTTLTENTFLEDPSFCNYDIMNSLVWYVARTDEYASMSLGGTSLNSDNFGGKRLWVDTISETGNTVEENGVVVKSYAILTPVARTGWTWALIIPPVLLLGAGVFVCVRRRFL